MLATHIEIVDNDLFNLISSAYTIIVHDPSPD